MSNKRQEKLVKEKHKCFDKAFLNLTISQNKLFKTRLNQKPWAKVHEIWLI